MPLPRRFGTCLLGLIATLSLSVFAGEKELTRTILHGLPGERVECPPDTKLDPIWRASCRKIGRKSGPAKKTVDELFASLPVTTRPDGPWRRLDGKLVRNFEVGRTVFEFEVDRAEKLLLIRYPNFAWCDEAGIADRLAALEAATGLKRTVVSKARPVYPMLARVARIEGRVTLRIVVGTDGTPAEVCVDSSSQSFLGFEAASVAAANEMRFEPALSDGAPIESLHAMTIDFELN